MKDAQRNRTVLSNRIVENRVLFFIPLKRRVSQIDDQNIKILFFVLKSTSDIYLQSMEVSFESVKFI